VALTMLLLPSQPVEALFSLVAEPGLLLVLIATLLSGLGLRRARRSGGGGGLTRAAGVLAAILLVAYLVAVWAMTAKPGA